MQVVCRKIESLIAILLERKFDQPTSTMSKLLVAKDVFVHGDGSGCKKRRQRIGGRANAAGDHRRINVYLTHPTPRLPKIEIGLQVPVLRELMSETGLNHERRELCNGVGKLPDGADTDGIRSRRLGALEVGGVDCRFLLTNAIQSLGLNGVRLIQRVDKQSPAEMKHPIRVLIRRPGQTGARRNIRK